MKTYDVACPICGTINRQLNLEETEGWMECEKCKTASSIRISGDSLRKPILTLKKLERVPIIT